MASYALAVDYPWPDTIPTARVLRRHGLTLGLAHAAITRLAAERRAVVTLPVVEDEAALMAELAGCGVAARRTTSHPADADPATVRAGTGLSQEKFARAFGLDVATVRNWEQGRSAPDTAARVLLRVIALRPDAVREALAADAAADTRAG